MNATISFSDLINRQISHIQVRGEGVVTNILNDDLKGHKHQRFIVALAPHKTVMILNNIDQWPRIEPLEVGDTVQFCGEYVWNRHGGLVHWTHEDPKGTHKDGYAKVIAEAEDTDAMSLTFSQYEVALMQSALDTWGLSAQVGQTIEEAAELIVALQKHTNRSGSGEATLDAVLDEIADVEMMLAQLRLVYGFSDTLLRERINIKFAKLEDYLKDYLQKDAREDIRS